MGLLYCQFAMRWWWTMFSEEWSTYLQSCSGVVATSTRRASSTSSRNLKKSGGKRPARPRKSGLLWRNRPISGNPRSQAKISHAVSPCVCFCLCAVMLFVSLFFGWFKCAFFQEKQGGMIVACFLPCGMVHTALLVKFSFGGWFFVFVFAFYASLLRVMWVKLCIMFIVVWLCIWSNHWDIVVVMFVVNERHFVIEGNTERLPCV